MAKKQTASEKLKSMTSALGKVVAKPIQTTPPPSPKIQTALPAEQIQPPKQATFRYHDRPKNYTETFLVRMTTEAKVKLERASYVLFRGSTDIAREAINKHLAELEAEHIKKTGQPFPPHPKEKNS